MKRWINLFLALLVLCTFTSCAEDKPLSRTVTALDTVCTVSLYDAKAEATLDAACALIAEYEQQWSRTIAGSEIDTINTANGAATTVSAATYELLQTTQFYTIATEGAFDITTAALTDLWKTAQERNTLPTEAELVAAQRKTGGYKLMFDANGAVTVEKGTTLDLGGVAKGGIADKLAQALRAGGCRSALIDLGGNIVAVGSKPSGEPFELAIADPRNPEKWVATVAVSDRAVVTSGSYQRGYEIGGKWYSHILDPKTGMPVENDLASVTILAPQATDADALSTACFVMGYEKASAFLESFTDMDAVFVKTDGTVIVTDGVERIR